MTGSGSPLETAIVGAGPAGVSAALWAKTYDLEVRWLDREGEVGGMLDRIENPVHNYPGGLYAKGAELSSQLRRQLRSSEVDEPEEAEVERIVRRGDEDWRLELADDTAFVSRSVLLATGTSYRHLGVPGEAEGMGRYVSQSTSRDAERFAGRTVAIVGGGDAGFEGALQLARRRCRVHMLLRSEEFRARPQFVEPALDSGRIFVHPIPTTVERIEEITGRNCCRLVVETCGERRTLEVACLFVRIGVDPVYPELDPEPEFDAEGYIQTDRRQETSVPGLYAAGEVTDAPLPSIAVAVGGGATALHCAADRLGLA